MFFCKKVENGGFVKKSGKWGCFVTKWKMGVFVRKWKMGMFCKKVENGVFCKKVDLFSTQRALCTVSVFFILHFTYLGVRAHPMHPRAYGPELGDIDHHRPRLSEGEVQRRFPHPQITAHS